MKIKHKKAWRGAGRRCKPEIMAFAERWADLIEARLSAGDTFEQAQERTKMPAGRKRLTDAMFIAAVKILSVTWEHGEELSDYYGLRLKRKHLEPTKLRLKL